MKKEEILLQAIGMLPDEMAAEDVTEELMAEAANIEKGEKRKKYLHKCSYALAAACFLVIITSLYLSGGNNIHQRDIISSSNINVITGKSDSNSVNSAVNSGKDDNIKLFVYGNIEQQKSYAKDKSYNNIARKEILYGKTVKLETVNLIHDNNKTKSSSKRAKEVKYIVFGMDRDFYFTISTKAGKTYIFNEKNGEKHFVNGEKTLCKAGNKVYFDISSAKTDKSSSGNIKNWDKTGKEVIAYTDIYLKNGKTLETAGRFYIGKKEKNKTVKDKEGDVYYGLFENKNGN
ncbi:MAG: hypothetical protein HFH68_06555 [Lachnospiraceae bacterium]|nr:hypothetical protein [Lachnospiraceae bacterium]